MTHGDKSSYTGKQKRQAEHIEEGCEARGVRSGARGRPLIKSPAVGKKAAPATAKKSTRRPPARVEKLAQAREKAESKFPELNYEPLHHSPDFFDCPGHQGTAGMGLQQGWGEHPMAQKRVPAYSVKILIQETF